MNYKARAERAEQNLRTSKPEISAAHREQLAFLAALQISDLLDSLLEMERASRAMKLWSSRLRPAVRRWRWR
jgi:hypothetical protein